MPERQFFFMLLSKNQALSKSTGIHDKFGPKTRTFSKTKNLSSLTPVWLLEPGRQEPGELRRRALPAPGQEPAPRPVGLQGAQGVDDRVCALADALPGGGNETDYVATIDIYSFFCRCLPRAAVTNVFF